MGWCIYLIVAFLVSVCVGGLVSQDIQSQAADLSWKGIPVSQTHRRAGIVGLWTLHILFAALIVAGFLFTKIEFGGVESTTYLGHDEQVENGHVIYTGE